MRAFVTAAAIACAAGAASAQFSIVNGSGTVSGNGNSGFGGVIGTGSMFVETLGDGTVNMTITRGSSGHFDATVIYIDSLAGGVTNTSMLTDIGDGGRAGISGQGFGGEMSDLGFATGFGADYAISYETAFGGMFAIGGDPANHAFVTTVFSGGADAMDATFTMSFNMSDIGLTAGDSFSFVATYLNNGNAYRSGEFIGTGDDTGFADGSNIGQNAYTLSDGSYVLVNSVPAPGAAAMLGLAGLTGLRRRR